MKNPILLFITLIIISCSVNKQLDTVKPLWFNAQEDGFIISCAEAENPDEYLARLAAKNIAFQTYPIKINNYLNSYVAENCITPGDEDIQKELDKVFNHFTNYLMNVADVQMELGEVHVTSIRGKGERCYVQLKIEQKYLHGTFVEFLKTSDLYMNLKLKAVLIKCFNDMLKE